MFEIDCIYIFEVFSIFVENGIMFVYVEGGVFVYGSFVKVGCFDEFYFYFVFILIGGMFVFSLIFGEGF